jgi:flavin-dependent thymidylate synthase
VKVSLIDYTGAGTPDPADHAANVLIFTKSTRLTMSPSLMEDIKIWTPEAKWKELEYMASTIPSSWEFCHYTFMVEGVSRAFTHQFVRSRTASFAQQTMRVLDVKGWEYTTGPSIKGEPDLEEPYNNCMWEIGNVYSRLIEEGAKVEDARGVLPTNIKTNIVFGCNLRTLAEMVSKRSSPRTQSEYRDVLEAIKNAAMKVHPWLSLFFERNFNKAATDLDKEILSVEGEDKKIRMLKLVDQLRKG